MPQERINRWCWQPDPDDAMPIQVQERHHDLLMTARDALALREVDPDHAASYVWMSDRFYGRAQAISAEWEDGSS